MKRQTTLMYLISFVLALTCLIFTPFAFAKEVNLYDQPQDGSKIIGKVDITLGVVPIFSQPDGKWMKVGDPRNGAVGWVKSSEMVDPMQPMSSISYTQQLIKDSQGIPHTYQLLQYGNPKKMDEKQAREIMQQMGQQDKKVQESIQNSIKALTEDLNKMYQQQQKIFNSGMPPFVIPVILYPQQGNAPKPAPTGTQTPPPANNTLPNPGMMMPQPVTPSVPAKTTP